MNNIFIKSRYTATALFQYKVEFDLSKSLN